MVNKAYIFFIIIIGIKPVYICIAPKPCHLTFGVMARVLLYEFNSSFEVIFAIKISKHFSVSYGLQAVQMAFWVYGFCFFHQSVVYHLQYAAVDAVV